MRGKKAMFFTLIAIIFVDILIFGHETTVEFAEADRMQSVKARVHMMNDFVSSLETDASRGLYISTFRSMVSINNYVTSQGEIIDVDTLFEEVIINGTIEGDVNNSPLMENQTLPDWITKMQVIADGLDINLSITILNTSISHSGPWSLEPTMGISYTAVDQKGLANFSRTVTIRSSVAILGWQDPLFALNTQGGSKEVVVSNVTTWNHSNLMMHMTNETFIEDSNGPSFLLRLENKTEASPDGISSVLDPTFYLNPDNRSMTDYLYWNETFTGNTSSVRNITDVGYIEFRLLDYECTAFDVTCY